MKTLFPCNSIQERIVAGEVLDHAAQTHVLSCASCAGMAAEWLALDGAMVDVLNHGAGVPPGFADRVMANLEAAPASSPWLEGMLARRWVQLVLAHVGAVIAVTNLLRFVFASLVPSASLAGVP